MQGPRSRRPSTRQAMAKVYFERLFDLRRKNPGDDLTTQLLHAEEDGSNRVEHQAGALRRVGGGNAACIHEARHGSAQAQSSQESRCPFVPSSDPHP